MIRQGVIIFFLSNCIFYHSIASQKIKEWLFFISYIHYNLFHSHLHVTVLPLYNTIIRYNKGGGKLECLNFRNIAVL